MQNFNKSIVVGIEPCKNVEKITKRKNFPLIQSIGTITQQNFLKKNIKI